MWAAAHDFGRLRGCLEDLSSKEPRVSMATTNDLKNGMTLDLDGVLWNVVEFQHVKPGKGGAFVRTKLKNVLTGQVVDRTFNAGTKVDTATVDRREMTYLYADGDDYVFMDSDTYDQMHVPAAAVGESKSYLLENMTATVATHEGTVLYVELPASVELVITYTEPGVQGDRSTGGTKPATLETGATVAVPLFITQGEKIKVDTRDGRYLGRVNS
jgi:elongation factor P